MKIVAIAVCPLTGGTVDGGWPQGHEPQENLHTLLIVTTDEGLVGLPWLGVVRLDPVLESGREPKLGVRDKGCRGRPGEDDPGHPAIGRIASPVGSLVSELERVVAVHRGDQVEVVVGKPELGQLADAVPLARAEDVGCRTCGVRRELIEVVDVDQDVQPPLSAGLTRASTLRKISGLRLFFAGQGLCFDPA